MESEELTSNKSWAFGVIFRSRFPTSTTMGTASTMGPADERDLGYQDGRTGLDRFVRAMHGFSERPFPARPLRSGGQINTLGVPVMLARSGSGSCIL